MKIVRGFKCAVRGILYTLKNERHMRIHTVVSFYVLLFSLFFDFSIEKYSLVFLVIALVMSMEMINSSIEGIVDMCSKEYSSVAKAIKDIAAGAVLIVSCFAVVIGLILFSDVQAYIRMWAFLCCNKTISVVLIMTFPISILYIKFGPVEIKNKIILFFKNKNIRN